mmetsp:Transcript_18619/g.27604  ORF Transcript_18619/g.27604 Transcript_18619/m.27604 type:complete len:486 (-) Transcript_18619:470-1927(-)
MVELRRRSTKKKKIIFIHLDLGIGGAEQLVLSLAAASQDAGHDVTIVTSHCSQKHCFDQVKKPEGRLCQNVLVWGKFLPSNIMGIATAFCSSLRMIYLSYWTAKRFGQSANLIVLDVLPTSIPFLTTWVRAGIIFYCHFPDKLLTRDTVNGEPTAAVEQRSWLRTAYRNFLDDIEERTMNYADVLVVNSKFTKSQVQQVFPSLQRNQISVLYPALDAAKFSSQNFSNAKSSKSSIISLNRFERKKNIELLIKAYALLQLRMNQVPSLIIAGGYDMRNIENVEYLQELKDLVSKLSIKDVQFQRSISDEMRSRLMRNALCVVYTPHLEHFGIVPIEAMYAGTPVIAVNSGGPKETVLDQQTGFLCDGNPEAFYSALSKLVKNPTLSTTMGAAGREHVVEKFGSTRFQKQWVQIVDEGIEMGKVRRMNQRRSYIVWRSFYYFLDAILAFGAAALFTYLLRRVGLLEENQHIIGVLQKLMTGLVEKFD